MNYPEVLGERFSYRKSFNSMRIDLIDELNPKKDFICYYFKDE